jgi:acyl-CoA synthetase (AMP-forming)/AMP-acid ligase II
MQVMATTAATIRHRTRAARHEPALLGDENLTYAQLDIRVAARAQCLAGPRRVHVLIARNTVDFVVDYLACLRLGHVVALTTACRADQVTYAHATDLHPDLAVLLPTSGSTGNPKLVRLSGHNLQANAESIACPSTCGRPTAR